MSRIGMQGFINCRFGARQVVLCEQGCSSFKVARGGSLRQKKRDDPACVSHIIDSQDSEPRQSWSGPSTDRSMTVAAQNQNSNRKTIWPVRGAGYVLF